MRREEIRQEITATIQKVKQTCQLEELHHIVKLFQQSEDRREYVLLSEDEWSRVSIIRNTILIQNTEDLKRLSSYIRLINYGKKK